MQQDLALSMLLSKLTLKSDTERKISKNIYEFGKKNDGFQGETGAFPTYSSISWSLLLTLII